MKWVIVLYLLTGDVATPDQIGFATYAQCERARPEMDRLVLHVLRQTNHKATLPFRSHCEEEKPQGWQHT